MFVGLTVSIPFYNVRIDVSCDRGCKVVRFGLSNVVPSPSVFCFVLVRSQALCYNILLVSGLHASMVLIVRYCN